MVCRNFEGSSTSRPVPPPAPADDDEGWLTSNVVGGVRVDVLLDLGLEQVPHRQVLLALHVLKLLVHHVPRDLGTINQLNE